MKTLSALLAILCLVLSTCWAAASTPADEVTRVVRAEMANQQIPGLALLVARNGVPMRSEGYGLANVELKVPVKPETIFQSGSIGKQFTALSVLMLADAGKIGLDDPIAKYFASAPSWWKDVTVRELLSHTAGFTDYPKDFDLRKDYSEDQLLALIQAIPPAYPPGTSWSYSNLGYVTLGILIRRVSGEYFGDYMQHHIFQPLGMSTTRIVDEAEIIPNRAAGYRIDNGNLKNQEWVAPTLNTTADGSLYFSIIDVAKWDAALYSDRLLKRSLLQQMWTPSKLLNGEPNSANYAFGWFIESQDGHRVFDHDGRWQGFDTQISRYPDDGLTVVVLTNLGSADAHLIADKVAATYLVKPAVDAARK